MSGTYSTDGQEKFIALATQNTAPRNNSRPSIDLLPALNSGWSRAGLLPALNYTSVLALV
jgi:hypothetical protein